MSFDMQKLGQFGLWVKAVSEQVSKNTDDIEELKQEIKQLRQENSEIKRKLGIKQPLIIELDPL
jgi:cell division protein FtsB